MRKISETTLIPLGVAVAAIGGAAIWLTTIHLQSVSNAETLGAISSKQERYSEDIHAIRLELGEIKGELKRLRR